ncbi:tRNA 4-thiouridine(8) synthase ThiI [Loigolactobacillus backii]|uniref:tRNA uracil 4-sulfurtransferase ThiI n=1 Tax=Loigolactobacillus backii TaxID=375175 RepID=UPI000C1C89AE|nr:tRNA uracil 4-sulfurtransferase ThiI [Loigolactobacillus backii]PIO83697.1 tRNA 4-thiouridine(8) synthase ThiI [Loigolactobacillus backii]
MQYTEIMVRYGELSTKGKNRRDFINRLFGNTMKALQAFPALQIHAKRDRLHIILNGEDSQAVMAKLGLVFGIQNYSPTIRVERDMNAVRQMTIAMLKEQVQPGATFKVNTRRADHNFEMDTNEINADLGDVILNAIPELTVKMHKPDITLRVEVRLDGIYLSSQTILGAGGLPVGTAGRGMLMLSGGIDSPVAGYLAMKRGVDLQMVHFFSPPYTSEKALAKAKELTAKIAPYAGSIQFIEVPFTKIQEEIKNKVPEGYLMTIQRRMMLRITDKIREMHHGLAIFNGESLGQVASQTMQSMAAINDVTTTPILRPVISMDKNEIIKIAEDIDTFDLSVMPFEDCCTIFAPPAPKTHPNMEKTRNYEKLIDVEGLMAESIAGIKTSEIRPDQHFLEQDQAEIADLL